MHIPVRTELKKRLSTELTMLLGSFAAICLPEDNVNAHSNFWQEVKDQTHPRAILDDMHRVVMRKWFERLPYTALQSRIGNVLNVLREVLAGERSITAAEMKLLENIHEAIRDERDAAQKQMNHLFAGEHFQKLEEVLNAVGEDYGVTVTVEQPKVRDDSERYVEQCQLVTKITNLNMQLHWADLALQCLMFLDPNPGLRQQHPRHVIKSVLAVLDMNADLQSPTREDWIEGAQADIMAALSGAAVRAAEPA